MSILKIAGIRAPPDEQAHSPAHTAAERQLHGAHRKKLTHKSVKRTTQRGTTRPTHAGRLYTAGRHTFTEIAHLRVHIQATHPHTTEHRDAPAAGATDGACDDAIVFNTKYACVILPIRLPTDARGSRASKSSSIHFLKAAAFGFAGCGPNRSISFSFTFSRRGVLDLICAIKASTRPERSTSTIGTKLASSLPSATTAARIAQ